MNDVWALRCLDIGEYLMKRLGVVMAWVFVLAAQLLGARVYTGASRVGLCPRSHHIVEGFALSGIHG